MKKHLLMLAIASTCFVAGQASALTQDEYKVAKEKIEADYKVDKAKCDTLKDNAKDVCQEEAKGKEKVEKAEPENRYKASPANARKVEEAKADSTYDIAKEKCEDQKGDAEKVCKADAKAAHERAMKAAKAKS